MLYLPHMTQSVLVHETLQYLQLADRVAASHDHAAKDVLHVRGQLRHHYLLQDRTCDRLKRLFRLADNLRLVLLPGIQVGEALVLHHFHRLLATQGVNRDPDPGGPAAGRPERRVLTEYNADRLVLGLDVVAETERDRQHAVALVVIHLLQRHINDRPLPEFVHRPDPIAERSHEHLGVSHHSGPFTAIRCMSRATVILPR